MSDLSFKTNFAELTEAETGPENYPTAANVRTVTFVLSDGNRIGCSYIYFVSAKLDITGSANTLTVRFTSDTITIKGYRLIDLQERILQQIPKTVTVTGERYAAPDESVIVSIET
jgi:hypothetical protein